MAATDYKVWLLSLIIITKTSAGAVTSFIPTLVATLGHSAVNTLLLSAPPYVFATLFSLVISYSSDRNNERALHIVLPILLGMAGFLTAACTLNFTARYISLFLMLGGVYGSYTVALAWISSTLPRPMEKRAAAFAIVNTVGNVAQIYSPYLYPKSQGPRYLNAMVANAVFCAACGVATLGLRWCLTWENRKLARKEEEEQREITGEKEGEVGVEAENPVGAVLLAPGFRYAL
jgi:MFS family permease